MRDNLMSSWRITNQFITIGRKHESIHFITIVLRINSSVYSQYHYYYVKRGQHFTQGTGRKTKPLGDQLPTVQLLWALTADVSVFYQHVTSCQRVANPFTTLEYSFYITISTLLLPARPPLLDIITSPQMYHATGQVQSMTDCNIESISVGIQHFT